MATVMLGIILFLSFAHPCFAQDSLPPQEEEEEEIKIIEVDFGEISRDTIHARTVEVLTPLAHVMSACDCIETTVTSYPDESRYMVEIFFDPQDYQGSTTQEVLLVDKEGDLTRIEIHAVVK